MFVKCLSGHNVNVCRTKSDESGYEGFRERIPNFINICLRHLDVEIMYTNYAHKQTFLYSNQKWEWRLLTIFVCIDSSPERENERVFWIVYARSSRSSFLPPVHTPWYFLTLVNISLPAVFGPPYSSAPCVSCSVRQDVSQRRQQSASTPCPHPNISRASRN